MQCESEPGRATCESPSDLLLTGKVLAATTGLWIRPSAADMGELRGSPAGKQAGAWLAPERVRKVSRFSTDGPRRTRNCSDREFFLCLWDTMETKLTGEPGEMFCCSGRMLG